MARSRNLDLIGGPSLRWNLFDHGQISNNVRVQDARLQQLIEAYRDKVRQAAREADDAANGLIKSLERERILREAEVAAKRSLVLASAQYREGYSDFQRVLDAQRALLEQQDNYLVSPQQCREQCDCPVQGPGRRLVQRPAESRSGHSPANGTTYRLGRSAGRARHCAACLFQCLTR